MKHVLLLSFFMSSVLFSQSGYAELPFLNGDFVFRSLTGQPKDSETREIIVRFKPGVNRAQALALHDKLGASPQVFRRLLPRMDVVTVQDASQAMNVLRAYQSAGMVQYAVPNYRVRRHMEWKKLKAARSPMILAREALGDLPSDPQLSKQWAIVGTTNINVKDAWKITTGDHRVIVGVVDTGLAFNHEDIKGNVALNEKEIPGNGIDEDKNGYVDDYFGYDMIDHKPLVGDDDIHGTHVSGIIGAKGNNGIGVAGINWNVSLLGVRTVPSDGDETDADVIEAFVYAGKRGARVINCSFGKAQSSMAVNDAINSLKDQTLFVVAAGNDSDDIDRRPTYPASFPADNILTVAALSSGGGLASFSNYGLKSVDIAAPGAGIVSTVPTGYANLSGTSMASPEVAGAAALVLSKFPTLTPLQLKQALMEGGAPKDILKGKTVSGKMLDVMGTLSYVGKRVR